MVQLSHPYITTGKNIALTKRTFAGKVMTLLFNMLSRLVTVFLPRSKRLLISWLQWPSAVILEPPKIKSITVSIVSQSICHEVMGPDAMIFIFRMLSLLQQQNTGLWIKRGREQQWLSLPVKMKQCFKIHLSPKHLPVVLIFIFLRMNDAEHLFMYPLAIWIFPGYLS